ncbi:uncharacterized protein LOC116169002 [Photinus pyralis]|uniref:uncharacterized protein LOC116169002 n=1 Tax=Photinus pyralis TaxID=7054 RepID=UPI0012671B3E|nr:uncharacterized protein LOC116169002 [Photinus pyralis]
MADELKKARGQIKSKLTRFQTFISKLNNDTVTEEDAIELQDRLEAITPLMKEYDETHSKMINLVSDVSDDECHHAQFESAYFKATSFAKLLLNKAKVERISISPSCNSDARSVNSSSHKNPFFNLPKISIPKFCGDLENWIEFREIFNSLIHSNEELNDVQRLHYLKSSLTGDASQVIKSLQFSAGNYQVAWKAICARYDQPRMLIRNHLRSILDLESCVKEASPALRKISDALFKHVTALRSLASDAQLFETTIIYIMSHKLDSTTLRQWERNQNDAGTAIPNFDEFKTFLTNTANLLDSLQSKSDSKSTPTPVYAKGKPQMSKSFVMNSPICILCKDSHTLNSCEHFLKFSPSQRIAKVKELKLCLNCLYKGHMITQCTSKYSCRTCKGRHHSLLHLSSGPASQEAPTGRKIESNPSSSNNDEPSQSIAAFCTNTIQVLLPTASAQILDSTGAAHTIRVLLDSGSQSNFIRASICQKLKLNVENANVTVSGLSKLSSTIRSKCRVILRSQYSGFQEDVSCLILEEITGTMPSFRFNCNIKLPKHIKLSDPSFNTPGNIDMLIGSPLFFSLLCAGQIRLGPNMPILQKTQLGWVISGPIGAIPSTKSQCNLSVLNDLPEQLAKFWELESYPSDKVHSAEETECETHFTKTVSRDEDGRFIVDIPFKAPLDTLGESYNKAQRQFFALERRLQMNPIILERYTAFMEEYQNLGHMSLSNASFRGISYYLPHHGVMKDSSFTTKLRVVFNGSSSTTSGRSINDFQMVGPTIQQDLFSILVRFRKYTYGISADIEKMYRQVLVNPDQRPLQRILWRPVPSEPLLSYDLNTVTYGTASASFLAIRCLYQIGIDIEKFDSKTSSIIKSDFYVDDLLTGADDLFEAQVLASKVSHALREGCFPIRKWISNDPRVLAHLPEEDIHPGLLELGSHDHTITLGLIWNFQTDSFTFTISPAPISKITKRTILSQIAQMFDPLGLLSPCTVSAKILLQQFWLEKLGWDDPEPQPILLKWSSYRSELTELSELQIPRHSICVRSTNIQLHGFCDASISAYGACIYLRSVDQSNKIHISLLCAKSKVAPLKPLTIPKLELSAVLLAKLVEQVINSLNMRVSATYLWSDSTIVLGWVKTSPNLLKTFICNRVADIQERTSSAIWRHVPTKCNPADLLSRGVTPKSLKSTQLWWNGPDWLASCESSWPKPPDSLPHLPEFKLQTHSLITTTSFNLIDKFSDISRLERVVAFLLRFINNCRVVMKNRITGPLTVLEIRAALLCLIKISQIESFGEDLNQLRRNRPLKRSSSIISLNPFLDSEGILRVGGRLRKSNYQFDKIHPIVLSGKHRLAKLLTLREHLRLLHAGPQLLLYSLRDQFWIISGRSLTKQTVHKCMKCFRFSPKLVKPIMADLPPSRVQAAPPFSTVGVDYGGPFLIKNHKGRGAKTSKSYLCLFICFVTKAVHLELVTSLTAESFIMTFRRFASRRGKPSHVYSDNGTNFVGSNSLLKDLSLFLKSNGDHINKTFAVEGTTWHFIPAHSPHFGGLWEAGIKSVKSHLRRVLGTSLLTYEEFSTLLSQIEATINSRPLSPLSSDPNDFQPLMPAHFLIGRPLTSLPDPDVSSIPIPRLKAFELVQQLHQRLWKRWSKEYVSELQQRTKWRSHLSDLKNGTLVLLKEDNQPPLHWKLGLVVAVHPGADGVARVASVKTINGVVKRSFAKICPLPIV